MKSPIAVINFPDDLPIAKQQELIAKAIASHQVIVIAGETGSGKTTQIPKICLALGRGRDKLIGHTQPRRIAVRAVAARLAQELNCELGQQVGYQIRFADKVSEQTYIKVMTDGILLAEIQRDRFLQRYDTLIIDEAHERSLNIDFILGYLKHVLVKRPALKVIITSATINPQQFSQHFNQAPIIEVEGRTYPVEVRYRPLREDLANEQAAAIIEALTELPPTGDVLVFLSSEREIRDTAEALRKQKWQDTEILPLYARLSLAEQNKIFKPSLGRRIVLATNVAETSLTVPGIRYVIDTGYARISRYSYRTKVQRLPIEPISQASANQRKGRCGREAPGICIRLYSEEDFNLRPLYTDPEILRTNLASVILQMAALRLGDIQQFPFLDKPDPRAIRSAYRLLYELQALTQQQQITPLGRQLANLAVDPKFARMLIAGAKEGCLAEILIIVSGLSIQDPRERPHDKQQAADEKQRQFSDEKSDFLSILKLWFMLHEQKAALSNNQFRKYCVEHFISYLRLQEWGDIYRQLRTQVEDMALRLNSQPADYQAIHRAILTGLLSQVAFKLADHEYLGTYSRHFYIFPGSKLAKKPPAWLMAAELLETTKLYAHTVASILPEWLEELAGHLLHSHYFEPHWQERQGYVGAYAKLTLFGLLINPKRKVNYGPIEPKIAREIFIREALVTGHIRTKAAFLAHNQKLLAELEQLEDKTRRRDILVDDYVLYEFYARQLPEGIYSLPQFETWYQKASHAEPQLLFLTEADLVQQSVQVSSEQFPDVWLSDDLSLKLTYHFAPGDLADGVTVEIPLVLLNQLPQYSFDWLVSGLLLEKMTALLKTLPKNLRRNFVPAPEFARACYEALIPANTALHEAMANHLRRITGIAIPGEAWQFEQLPAHLLMNFKVIDEQNNTLAMGRDLKIIKAQLQGLMQAKITAMPTTQLERSHITHWDFDDLPRVAEVKQQHNPIQVYPALVDKKNAVSIELFAEQAQASQQHRLGLLRLFSLASEQSLNYLQKQLFHLKQLALLYTTIGSKEQLLTDLLQTAVYQTYLYDDELIYQAEQFTKRLAEGKSELISMANEIAQIVEQILMAYQTTLKASHKHPLRDEMIEQLQQLVYPGFIFATPQLYLKRLPIYLQAMQIRLSKYLQNPGRDKQLAAEVKGLWQNYASAFDKTKPEVIEYRWLLEEYKISLFAQPLKTLMPVSHKRLEQLWEKIK
ncbi:MAG: hrpA [Gammaproteobacteria bacterium]|jgi:ATP-dependent helicase HrpA|nr:hrpA [Gammaproteobacteria bacterium]